MTTPTEVRTCQRCAREYVAALDDLDSTCAHCELASLANRRELAQIDCAIGLHGDSYADDDGDLLEGGRIVEPVKTPFTVRVLVEPGTDPAVAARLLRKTAMFIEAGDPEVVAAEWPPAAESRTP